MNQIAPPPLQGLRPPPVSPSARQLHFLKPEALPGRIFNLMLMLMFMLVLPGVLDGHELEAEADAEGGLARHPAVRQALDLALRAPIAEAARHQHPYWRATTRKGTVE
jgi:hypothetical protein